MIIRKTQILEVEHEPDFVQLPLSYQKRLFESLMTFYNKYRDLRSVEAYELKIKESTKRTFKRR